MKATKKNQAAPLRFDKESALFPNHFIKDDMSYHRFMVRPAKAAYTVWHEPTNKLVQMLIITEISKGKYSRQLFNGLYSKMWDDVMDVMYQ